MDTVVVTGFGPFNEFKINASWEVAKELSNMDFAQHNVNLVTEEMPVVYETVTKRVPELWELHKPMLMVHIGVSAFANELTIETCANSSGYSRNDIQGKTPNVVDDCLQCINTCLDVESVVLQYNAKPEEGVSCTVSNNAGRYLCEFIFYNSLCIQKNTIFIHVPDIGKPYSVTQMGKAAKQVILLFLDQLRNQKPALLENHF